MRWDHDDIVSRVDKKGEDVGQCRRDLTDARNRDSARLRPFGE